MDSDDGSDDGISTRTIIIICVCVGIASLLCILLVLWRCRRQPNIIAGSGVDKPSQESKAEPVVKQEHEEVLGSFEC